MSPTGLQVNKPVVVVVIGIVVTLIIWFKMSSKPVEVDEAAIEKGKSWKGNLVDLPAWVLSDIDKADVPQIKKIQVKVEGKKVTVAYREAKADNSKVDVLFLHGMSFKSETWVTKPMFTLQVLLKLGFRAVAIDLPGFGESPSIAVDKAAYMTAVIKELKLDSPVIVSPSMSGGFSLPYLFKDPENVLSRSRGFVPVAPGTTEQYNVTHYENLHHPVFTDSDNVLSRSRGYVPVAPVNTESYTVAQYEALKIPSCIIYGEKDVSLGQSSLNFLKHLPQNEQFKLSDAGHACYLNKPDDFHKILFNFLKSIQK